MKDEKTGDDLVSIGFVVDLNYRDATTSAHDLLQPFKTHPLVQGDPRGRRADRLGRQGAARRRLLVDAQAVDAGRGAGRRRRRHGRHGGAEGRPSLHQVRDARRGGDLRRPRRGVTLERYEQAVEDSVDRPGALPGAQHPPGVPEGLRPRRPLANLAIRPRGGCPGAPALAPRRRRPMFIGDTRERYPKPDGKYTFDKLSAYTSRATPPATTRPTTSACTARPREIAERWRYMCPAGVYEIPDDAPETGPST